MPLSVLKSALMRVLLPWQSVLLIVAACAIELASTEAASSVAWRALSYFMKGLAEAYGSKTKEGAAGTRVVGKREPPGPWAME